MRTIPRSVKDVHDDGPVEKYFDCHKRLSMKNWRLMEISHMGGGVGEGGAP